MSDFSFEDWKKIDLRVGEIATVEDHPNADKLVVMTVDMGNETRTLVAGLKEHYDTDELVGKKVVVFTNLEQKELRGVKSEGMVLAAVNDDTVVLISPEMDIPNGARIQ